MRKKMISVALIAVMSLSLFACGSNKESSKENPSASEASVDMPEVTLKLGFSTNEEDPRAIAAKAFADEVSEKTGGKVTVELYPSGQLGGDADLINSISLDSGTVDIIITDASNFATYEPKMGISALPFQFNDFDEAWAFMDSEIEAEAESGLIEQNMRVLAHYCNGFRCVTSSKGAVETPEDMKGLLIRTPENPVIMATMSALGANPQPLSFSELYQALQQGTYDAQENPIPVIYNNNLFEVQKYLSVTNHIYSGMCFTIAESSWKKLSTAEQEIVQAAATASAEKDRELNKQQTEELVSKLEENGMQINNPDLTPFAETTASVLTDNADTYGDLLDKLAQWKTEYEK
ncbi:TRAP transporter substrate-binding protein [Anaeromicropila populeti]|uniref:Tripartite ATP-independent transporter solute receptor, DctP family n=1 Tax=Anaeromicropila populeti TaxID=37658 RepID=A0A1I6K8L8_9FIRM|nr:TRAP transporter substrate-binding protein [Anaeromicropila populeti]SFR87581.1 tripartite ATP-independent transporter solute receptor, DctP family [Anaeromicropila populeti]